VDCQEEGGLDEFPQTIVIIGGGAAGFFGAIAAAVSIYRNGKPFIFVLYFEKILK